MEGLIVSWLFLSRPTLPPYAWCYSTAFSLGLYSPGLRTVYFCSNSLYLCPPHPVYYLVLVAAPASFSLTYPRGAGSNSPANCYFSFRLRLVTWVRTIPTEAGREDPVRSVCRHEGDDEGQHLSYPPARSAGWAVCASSSGGVKATFAGDFFRVLLDVLFSGLHRYKSRRPGHHERHASLCSADHSRIAEARRKGVDRLRSRVPPAGCTGQHHQVELTAPWNSGSNIAGTIGYARLFMYHMSGARPQVL